MDAARTPEVVFHASYRRLVAQLLVACGSQQEAEDAVQEAFVRAIAQGRRWYVIDNPEAWLRTVAVNHVRNRARRTRVFTRLLLRVPGPTTPLEPSPERVAVEAALAHLRPDLRVVVALHYVADLPLTAIAAQLELPLGTVKSRLARARELLGVELSLSEGADHA